MPAKDQTLVTDGLDCGVELYPGSMLRPNIKKLRSTLDRIVSFAEVGVCQAYGRDMLLHRDIHSPRVRYKSQIDYAESSACIENHSPATASCVTASDDKRPRSGAPLPESVSLHVPADCVVETIGVGGKGARRLLGHRPDRACPGVSTNFGHSPPASAISSTNSAVCEDCLCVHLGVRLEEGTDSRLDVGSVTASGRPIQKAGEDKLEKRLVNC